MTLDEILAKHGIKKTPCVSDLPSGWADLVDDLCKQLVAAGWDKDLHQVKEKFGGLRFYIGAGTPEIDAAIEHAEGRSFKTCQGCGGVGRHREFKGWLSTECNRCFMHGTGAPAK